MQTATQQTNLKRYAKCIEVSKRIRWEIDRDVIRGRTPGCHRTRSGDGAEARSAWSSWRRGINRSERIAAGAAPIAGGIAGTDLQ